jgi:nitrogen fixation NifU-like protein
MNDDVYHERIKALARASHGAGRLDRAHGRGTADNPLCGDQVAVEIGFAGDGRIAAFAQEVRGCMLCQASASGLAVAAQGRRPEELPAAKLAIEAMLKHGDAEALAHLPAFAEFAAFLPAHRHRSRHDCIVLPFRAAERALADAAGKEGE